jgi:hypothetical protein
MPNLSTRLSLHLAVGYLTVIDTQYLLTEGT